MYAKESEIVNEDFLRDENTYNLKRGGFGGFDYINSKGLNNKVNQCSKAGKAANGKGFRGKSHSALTKQHLSKVLTGRPATFKGKTHTEHTKQKMSAAKKNQGLGDKNSQFGTMWITDGVKSFKIKKEDFAGYQAQGYLKGRIIKTRVG